METARQGEDHPEGNPYDTLPKIMGLRIVVLPRMVPQTLVLKVLVPQKLVLQMLVLQTLVLQVLVLQALVLQSGLSSSRDLA